MPKRKTPEQKFAEAVNELGIEQAETLFAFMRTLLIERGLITTPAKTARTARTARKKTATPIAAEEELETAHA